MHLDYAIVIGPGPEHKILGMFALYDNYKIIFRRYSEDVEKQIMSVIRTELDLGDQGPMWYWDSEYRIG